MKDNTEEKDEETKSDNSPVMNIKKMSDKERRRLTISPTFRDRLNTVFAKKVCDVKEKENKDKNVKQLSKNRKEDVIEIPVPPPPPNRTIE